MMPKATFTTGALSKTVQAARQTLPYHQVLKGEYTLKVFNEQYNGDYKTDYASGFKNITLTVGKLEQTAPQAPELESRTQNSITLKAISPNANGAKAQYSMNGGNWQDSPVFTGLSAGTEYSFKARYMETDSYAASPAGSEAKLSTKGRTYIKPAPDIVISGKTVAVTITDVRIETVKNGQGENTLKITAILPQTLADKLADAAASNSADIIEITVKPDNVNKAGQIELQIPESAVESIANNTNATLSVKTDISQLALDNRTLAAIAAEAEGDTVKITVNQNAVLKETQKTVLNIIGDRGYIFDLAAFTGTKNIHDFKGGMAHVKTPVPEKLKNKDIAVIYISDKGICEILNHTMETAGADKYIKFTTTYFSTFAVVEKPDADKLIQQQNLDTVKALIKEIEAMGYTVKYRFCRAAKTSDSYIGKKTKDTASWINTKGKKGAKYYYKAKVYVYDGDILVGKTALKQCSYSSRVWSK